jgi:hypothetical protein
MLLNANIGTLLYAHTHIYTFPRNIADRDYNETEETNFTV